MKVDMFLKLADIKGEAEDKAHPAAIQIKSMSWDITQGTANHNGRGGSSGRVSVGSVILQKSLDVASPSLRALCCQGMQFPTAAIIRRKAGGVLKPLEYYKLSMKEVLITGLHLVLGEEGQNDLEILSLSFTEFVEEYTPQNAEGLGGAPVKHGFNINRHVRL